MKKIICLFFAIMAVVICFVACSKSVDIGVDGTEHSTKTTIETTETTTEEESPSEAVIPASVDWRDCTITLAGKEITLPCEYSKIADAGWKIPDKNMGTYFPNNGIWYMLAEKDGTHDIGLYLINTTGEKLTYDKCIVAGISVFNHFGDDFDYSDVVFPGDITIGTIYDSSDDAYSVYGTPDVETGSLYAYWGKSEKIVFGDLIDDGTGVKDYCDKSFMTITYGLPWDDGLTTSEKFSKLAVKEMRLDLSRELTKGGN